MDADRVRLEMMTWLSTVDCVLLFSEVYFQSRESFSSLKNVLRQRSLLTPSSLIFLDSGQLLFIFHGCNSSFALGTAR
jgi:hypothetical protein